MVCIVQSHSYSQLTQKKGNIVYLTIPYQYVTVDDLTCCIMTGDNSATITAWLFTHSHNVILNIRKALSHWCVFHHRYCRLVVETWDCEFRVASSERRLSLLYLANDIMQNSRKEGNGYITEFMRVIPAALNEVLTIRDDLGRNVVKRLVCSTYSWYQCSWKSIVLMSFIIVFLLIICITTMLTTSCPFWCAYIMARLLEWQMLSSLLNDMGFLSTGHSQNVILCTAHSTSWISL